MLYGLKETVDDRTSTCLVAADTMKEFEDYIHVLCNQGSESRNWVGVRSSEMIEHFTAETFKGFSKQVICFFHDSDEQRDKFIEEWKIQIQKPFAARDTQANMLEKAEKEAEAISVANARAEAEKNGEEYRGQTIGELYGLTDDNDPWDRRSEKEIEQDKHMKEMMKEMRKAGTLSDDSFGDANAQKAAKARTKHVDETAVITSIETTVKDDGTITIESAKARKYTDESVETPAEVHTNYGFSPEDFAAALTNDGSSDVFNVRSNDPTGLRGLKSGGPVFNDDTQSKIDDYRAKEEAKARTKREQIQREMDLKAKQERESGIFRGADLLSDDTIPWAELPENIRTKLETIKVTCENIPVKNYPYNSEVGGKVLIPCSTGMGNSNDRPFTVILTDNLDVKGTLTVGDSMVMVAEKADTSRDGWVIIARADPKKINPETELPEPTVYRPWAIKVRPE